MPPTPDARNRFILTPRFLEQPLPAARRLASPDWCVLDSDPGQGDQITMVAASHGPLAHAVAEATRAGERPVSIAGDCCQTVAVVAGLQRAGVLPVVVWLDAHGDFNTWETSPSGFIGGMPLAMLVGRGEGRLMRAAGTRPVPESDVILTDARDLDPGERAALEGSGVHRTAEIAKLPRMVPPGRPVYVHLDLDVIDPADAPAMHYPVKGGPTAARVGVVLRDLAATGQVVAVSLTLWDLANDVDRRTETACLGALHALVGGDAP